MFDFPFQTILVKRQIKLSQCPLLTTTKYFFLANKIISNDKLIIIMGSMDSFYEYISYLPL